MICVYHFGYLTQHLVQVDIFIDKVRINWCTKLANHINCWLSKVNYKETFACNGSSLKLNAHTTIKKKRLSCMVKEDRFPVGGYVYPWMVSMTFDMVDALY